MMVFAKILSETHHVIEIAFYRNLIATLPFLFIIFVMGKRDILVIQKNLWLSACVPFSEHLAWS